MKLLPTIRRYTMFKTLSIAAVAAQPASR
jgi:hypothetical protein